MPPQVLAFFSGSCEGRVRQCPICCQCTKSRLWKMGTPGKYWKLLFTK